LERDELLSTVHHLVIAVNSSWIGLVHVADALVDVSLPYLHLVQGVKFLLSEQFAVRLVIDHILGPPILISEVLVVVAHSAHLNRGSFVVQLHLIDGKPLLD
jgi:hypothetical protein